MQIHIVQNEEDAKKCFPIMEQLRPMLEEAIFLASVKRQSEFGYKMAYLEDDGLIRTVAGFRISENFCYGRYLEVDDLITDEQSRGQHYGSKVFQWMIDYAKENGCKSIELDSRVHRFSSHQFYLCQNMQLSRHHFTLSVD